MLVQTGQLPQRVRTPWPGAQRTLLLAAGPISGSTSLAFVDATLRLRAEIEVLSQELAEMELELATAQGELGAFGERYHALIAGRIAELDRMQAELAQIRLRHSPADPVLDAAARDAQARASQSRRESEAYQDNKKSADESRFAPSNDLKKRFRQLAQKIHPDRASNEADRAWRTQLMSEANRAYRAGDATALDEVLSLWQEGRRDEASSSRGAVPPAPSSEATAALTRQAEGIRRRIGAIAAELDRLFGSRLYELFAAARVARRQGRDLLTEMAERLDAQIAAARAALAALEAIPAD
jgi:hypothetical protein